MFTFFRIIAFLEGLSFLLLLFIASPLKHFYNEPSYVKLLGMPHGVLFMGYVIMAILLKPKLCWDKATLTIVLLASIIPFGTFYVEYKYLKVK